MSLSKNNFGGILDGIALIPLIKFGRINILTVIMHMDYLSIYLRLLWFVSSEFSSYIFFTYFVRLTSKYFLGGDSKWFCVLILNSSGSLLLHGKAVDFILTLYSATLLSSFTSFKSFCWVFEIIYRDNHVIFEQTIISSFLICIHLFPLLVLLH